MGGSITLIIMKTNLDLRVKASADNQICEHLLESEWERAATAIGLQYVKTSRDAKWLVPGMKISLYHWQWHAIFIIVLMNPGKDDQYGGVIADKMGLGKVS